MAFRDEFPVLERLAYLNAGTDGPLPRAAVEQACGELAAQLDEGRVYAHFMRRHELMDELRSGYAELLHCTPEEVAVTSGTSSGLGLVMAGLELGPGDEIVTTDSEHPGLIGPLIAARHRGAKIRAVPIAKLAEAVEPTTTLVAASHVSWITGEVTPPELAEVGVPVILDGAQGAGAIEVDVKALNCVTYAAAGQKWLCGADGTGMLYLEPEFGERVRTTLPTYFSFEDTSKGLEGNLRAGAQRLDGPLPREVMALSAAALKVLRDEGFETIFERGTTLAARLADALRETGRTVAPRGPSTLVSFEHEDPEGARAALLEAGVVVRNLPGYPYLRASVGGWNDESDLERLLAAL